MRAGTERLGPYTYRWSEHCFPLGADSLALGEFCTLKPGDRVLDLGCGAGLLLLLCARRQTGLTLTGVELEEEAAALAEQNLKDNILPGTILRGDLGELSLPGGQDLVISNPPWYRNGAGREGGPGRLESCTLDRLCAAAARALAPKGRLALVHRPERLTDLLCAMRAAGVEPKRLRLCAHHPDKPPFAVLVEGVKGGRPGLTVLPQLN